MWVLRNRGWLVTALAVVTVAGWASPSFGAVWLESGDAGSLPGSAQVVNVSGALTQINGVLPGPDDVDMYLIRVTNPATFSAVSTGGLPYNPPRLFLFDASAVGVTGYFDSTNTGASLSGTSVTTAGPYYLAMSGYSHPLDATGSALWATTPTDTERAPDGPASTHAMTQWSASIVPYNPTNYTITLTGAASVPEPALGTLALTGLAALGTRRWRPAQGRN